MVSRLRGIDSFDLEALDRGTSGRASHSAGDGLLAAIAAGPVPGPPEAVLAALWRDTAPPLAGEGRHVFETMRARLDQIVRQLEEDQDAYAPVFRTIDDGAVVAADWATGFMSGVQDVRPDLWAPLTGTEEGQRLLVPILCQVTDWDEMIKAAPGGEGLGVFRCQGRKLIPFCVAEIRRFWQRRHAAGGGGAARGAGGRRRTG